MSVALNSKAIVNTRAAHQAEALNTLLRARGAVPLDYPCIAIAPHEDSTLLDAALCDLIAGRFDWLILTSANTVMAVAQRLKALGLTLAGAAFRTAAVGPATAEAAQAELGLELFDLPPQYLAESLVEHLPVETGARVLLPESAIARPTLADRLADRGAVVAVVDAYQTVCGHGGADIPQLLAQKRIDALTFTSSSTVTYFLNRLDKEGGRPEDALPLFAACIGPKTAATARDHGFTVLTTAAEHTLDGLIDALDTYFANRIDIGKQT
ncbi:uroporphyrinogen-III synthase [Anaerolineae bacterium CFX8]|nr:uroporphyrinogen-III synthase [Anaerolineae bacterium CFX8]